MGEDGHPGLIETYRQELRLRNYSPKTIKGYTSFLRRFVRYFRPRHPRVLTNADVREYLIYLFEQEGLAPASVNQAYNAIRFLYVELYHRPFVLESVPRPKRQKKLPVVLSKEELKRIFAALGNLKHRVLLMVCYSAGLRVSELVHLKIESVDKIRGLIHVQLGKGSKDRYTLLSKTVVRAIEEYIEECRPREWLFEGKDRHRPYSIRSAEEVFKVAAKKAGITKEVSIHSLRHSFATHLLEDGVDIEYIKELLGHESIRTTQIYTHVSKRKIAAIRSPLDDGEFLGAR